MKKLTNSNKIQIISLYKDGYPKKYISETIGCSISSVSNVLKLSGTDPQLFRLYVWEWAYFYYKKHYEHKNNGVIWRNLSQEQRDDIYKLVLPMVRIEAEDYLRELGIISSKRTIKDLEEENSQLKRLLLYYMNRNFRTTFI